MREPSIQSTASASAPSTGNRLQAGRLICGRYQLISLIGQGGMGQVWKASARNRPNAVALKLLPPDFCSDQQMLRMRQRFSLVEQLAHPHICTVMDLDVDPDIGPFLVMRYLEGITLAQYIQRQRGRGVIFEPMDVYRLLMPLASALDYAHDQGVVHRDIKPDNIIIAEDGLHPVIVDFELAEQIRDTLTRQSGDSLPEGTLAYLSPEAWRGKATNRQADQYALALIAYEMLAGELPFEKSACPDVLRQCTLFEPMPAIVRLPAVNEPLNRGLAKEPENRFPTCSAFVEQLLPGSPPSKAQVGTRRLAPELSLSAQSISIVAATVLLLLVLATWNQSEVHTASIAAALVPTPPTPAALKPPVQIQADHPHPPAAPDPTPLQMEVIRARQQSIVQRQTAEKAGAAEFANASWKTAEFHRDNADRALKDNAFSTALLEYTQATDTYKQATQQAQQLAEIAKQLPALQLELTQLHQRALEVKAEEFATERFHVAQSAALRFEQHKQSRAYTPAMESYQQSKAAYIQATEDARSMCRVEQSRAAYQQEIEKFEPATLAQLGGQPWKAAQDRIAKAEEPLEPEELIAAHREAIALLPTIRSAIRRNQLAQLNSSGQHRQVLDELWPSYSTASPELRAIFLSSAEATPQWWFEQAEACGESEALAPATRSLLKVCLAESARIVGKPFQSTVEDALEMASSIRAPLEALLTSFEIAQELVRQSTELPPPLVEQALVQVERDIKALDANSNDLEKSALNQWIKNSIRLRCAAIYWRVGKQEASDALSQMAYASTDPSRTFYYDLPGFHAVMIFAEAGDWKRLAKMTILRDGQLKISHLQGQRPYHSLMNNSIGMAGMNHGETSNADWLFAMGHAEVALAAARSGQRDMFLVHYRRANELIEGARPHYNRQLSQVLNSTLQSRMALAEASQNDFVSALGRLNGAIKDRQALGEAGVEIGRLQLQASERGSRNTGVLAAKATLESLDNLPRSAMLAHDIAMHWAQTDLAQVVQWAHDSKNSAQKTAIMAGIASGLKLKK